MYNSYMYNMYMYMYMYMYMTAGEGCRMREAWSDPYLHLMRSNFQGCKAWLRPSNISLCSRAWL